MGNSGGSIKKESQRKGQDRHSLSALKLIDGVSPPSWLDSIQELAPRKNALYVSTTFFFYWTSSNLLTNKKHLLTYSSPFFSSFSL